MANYSFTVSSEADLNGAISAISIGGADAGAGNTYSIVVSADITLTQGLIPIDLTAGDTLAITGNVVTNDGSAPAAMDGGGAFQGFVVEGGAVTLTNLGLQGMAARGGSGGSGARAGGGGAGLGGAVFVGAAASVDLVNVTFVEDAASGGRGGSVSGTGTGAGGAGAPAGLGFDGGAGGVAGGFGGGGGTGASGGFGAGSNGGGGLAAGSDIFVQQGGALAISGGSVAAGNLSAGGRGGGTAGSAYGNGVFLQGNTTIVLSAVTVTGVIADQTGSSGTGANGGAGTVDISGAVTLSAANTYTGGTLIENGSTLTLTQAGSAGRGSITFAGPGQLQIASGVTVANKIAGFTDSSGASIDLQGIGIATTATLEPGNTLVVSGGTTPVTLDLDPSQNYSADTFVLQSDNNGGTVVDAVQTSFVVTSEADLDAAIQKIDLTGTNSEPNTSYTITFATTITLSSDLYAINLAAGDKLTIAGAGQMLDGANAYRGFFDYSGVVAIDDLTIANTTATGGAGGSGSAPGAGGAGLGGGLFVSSGGAVTLSNVSFASDSAVGGSGGAVAGAGYGGGGGLGGTGGAGSGAYDGAGGGGGVGVTASGGSLSSAAGTGIILGAAGGNSGQGGSVGVGGTDGGGGGHGGEFSGSGRDPRPSPGAAGSGGVAGGFGGGAGSGELAGFGGGGAAFNGAVNGSPNAHSANGGFGGGAAGGGTPGFGGGSGGAGGGLGAGGDIFVEQGGSLTIDGGTMSGGSVSGGAGTDGGTSGSAFGSGIFIQGGGTLALAPASGQALTIGDVIADETGSGGSGVAQLVLSGTGAVALDNTNTYSGGTVLDSGTLSLQSPGAAGTGNITFTYGDQATLVVASGDVPTNIIYGLLTGDTIDLQGIGTATSATPGAGNVLSITGGTTPVTLYLDPTQNLTGESFNVASDNSGGTLLTAVDVGGDHPPHISGAGITINATDAAAFDPFAGVTVGDLDSGDTESATLTLSSTANGTLSNLGGGSYDAGTGIYTLNGSAAAVTAALDALVFTPVAHEVAPGNAVDTSFSLSVTDGTMIDAATNVAHVVAQNTPPAIVGLAPPFIPGYFTVAGTPFAGTSIVDPDVGAIETMTLTTNDSNGTLALAGPVDGVTLTETAPGSGVYTLSAGTPAAITAALDAVTFTPNYFASGFTINGLGLSASDGAATTTASTSVLAGAPVFSGTVAGQAASDAAPIAPFGTVTITDSPEFTSDTLTLTVTNANGIATDANGFLAGAGLSHIGAGLYQLLSGTPAYLTSELDALVFSPTEHQVAAGQSVATSFTISVFNGASTSDNGNTSVVATATAGSTYTLTTGADTVAGGAGDNKIVAKGGTVNAGDSINGGSGINSLVLSGAGTFDLRLPGTLANIAFVDAREGQAASGTTFKKTVQTLYLRSGLDARVEVAPVLLAGNPNPATITIVGAAGDSSTINLSSGNDVVTVGDTAETVNGGSGIDTIKVTAATIGAKIDGGLSRASVLSVSGGGTMAMGASIVDIGSATLAKSSLANNFTANGIAGLTVDDLSTGHDTIAAGGAGQVLTGGGIGKLTMNGFVGGATTFRDTSALLNGDKIGNFAAAGDVLNLTDMNAGTVTGTFSENAAGTIGKLSITDGTHSAAILLLGQFAAAGFSGSVASAGFAVSTDPVAGTNVTYSPVVAAAVHP